MVDSSVLNNLECCPKMDRFSSTGVKILCDLRAGSFLIAASVLSRGGWRTSMSGAASLKDGGWRSMERRSGGRGGCGMAAGC